MDKVARSLAINAKKLAVNKSSALYWGASGSDNSYRGSGTLNGNVITLDTPNHDFVVGQGILAGGLGPDNRQFVKIDSDTALLSAMTCREMFAIVIENPPEQPGNLVISGIPNVPDKTYAIQATQATFSFDVTGAATANGYVMILADKQVIRVRIAAGDTAVMVASRIRKYFTQQQAAELWTVDSATGSSVTITSKKRGPVSRCEVKGVDTGATFGNAVFTQGIAPSPRDIAMMIKNDAVTTPWPGWSVEPVNASFPTYDDSSVIYVIATTPGYKGADNVSVTAIGTFVKTQVTVNMFGSYLLAKITDVKGASITIDQSIAQTKDNVWVGHDDTAALKAALLATNTLYIPSGFYRISNVLSPRVGQIIYGDGKTSIISSHGYSHHGFLVNNGVDDVEFRGLMIRDIACPGHYNSDDLEGHGIHIMAAAGTKITNVDFDCCDDSAITVGYRSVLETSGDPGYYPNKVRPKATNTLIDNVRIRNTSQGSGIELIRCVGTVINNVFIANVSQHVIRYCGSTNHNVNNVKAEYFGDGFSFQGFGNSTVVLQRTQNGNISNCQLKYPYSVGIALYNQSQDITFTNIHIISLPGVSTYGIQFAEGTSVWTEALGYSSDIDQNACRNIRFIGCMTEGFAQCVRIRGEQENIEFVECTFKLPESTGTACGILVDNQAMSDVRGLKIEGCTLDCLTANSKGISLDQFANAQSEAFIHRNTFNLSLASAGNLASWSINQTGTTGGTVERTFNAIDTNRYKQFAI